MREFSTPLTVAVPATGNLTDDVVRNAAEAPDAVVFSRRPPGSEEWQDVTAAEFLAEVRDVAKGLLAAGVEAGDRVALISRTRYEWTLSTTPSGSPARCRCPCTRRRRPTRWDTSCGTPEPAPWSPRGRPT